MIKWDICCLETNYIVGNSLCLFTKKHFLCLLYNIMSAGDYISLKKSKMLQNYAPILSSGNKAVANYDHYVRKLALNTVNDSCSTDFYGDAEEKSINNILINCRDYPANTFEGVLNPTPISLIPNDRVGLDWKAYDGSMLQFSVDVNQQVIYNLVPNFFSTAGPKFGAKGQSSGVSSSLQDISFGTNGNFIGDENVDDKDENDDRRSPFVIEWTGYFLCTQTGNWTFNLRTLGRDFSFFWIGPIAETGYNTDNTFIKHIHRVAAGPTDIDPTQSNTIYMERNKYYKMRIQYSQPNEKQFLSLSFTDPNGNTTFDGTKNYFRENVFYFNQISYPLKSIPSVPAKLQQSCYRGEQPCTIFIHAKRATHISNIHRRQWNQKKKEMLQITDSTTYKM